MFGIQSWERDLEPQTRWFYTVYTYLCTLCCVSSYVLRDYVHLFPQPLRYGLLILSPQRLYTTHKNIPLALVLGYWRWYWFHFHTMTGELRMCQLFGEDPYLPSVFVYSGTRWENLNVKKFTFVRVNISLYTMSLRVPKKNSSRPSYFLSDQYK